MGLGTAPMGGYMRYLIITTLLALFWPLSSIAHSARTNAEGCHNNTKTGEYECHESSSPTARAASVRKSASGTRKKWGRTGPAWTMPVTHPPYRAPESLVYINKNGQPWLLFQDKMNGPYGETCRMVERQWECVYDK